MHSVRWITKNDAKRLERRAKRPKPYPDQDHESRGEMWASGSSDDEDREQQIVVGDKVNSIDE